MMRHRGVTDHIIGYIDTGLRTVCTPLHRHHQRNNPANSIPESRLSLTEKRQISGLMRVNHAGEVCAQALYQGQALTARLDSIKDQMAQAAQEEIDHLAWCETRLKELGSHPSRLNPLWYSGSFFMGALAGFIGDRWSLGFVAETERQVSAHLTRHIHALPIQDEKTKAILLQMKTDEIAHATSAEAAGAKALPPLVKKLMNAVSKLLTMSSYHI